MGRSVGGGAIPSCRGVFFARVKNKYQTSFLLPWESVNNHHNAKKLGTTKENINDERHAHEIAARSTFFAFE
jgi:hypothetical protein